MPEFGQPPSAAAARIPRQFGCSVSLHRPKLGLVGLWRGTRVRSGAAVALGFGGAALLLSAVPVAAASPLGFARPVFVDQAKAGGEPFTIRSTKTGNLVYSSHEGTTHLDRAGLAAPVSVVQFLCPGVTTVDCYKNHVWIWRSSDHGKTWISSDEGLTYTGFSDPDLTEDTAGNIYDAGIDLVNDTVFSSPDGGRTWPHGNTNCHGGDRPWLAGGVANEVFVSINASGTGHTIFHSTDAADTCTAGGIPDNGTLEGGVSYHGTNKPIYDRADGSLIETAMFTYTSFSGIGFSRLAHAAAAFGGSPDRFVPIPVATHTTYAGAVGPSMAMDAAENLYIVWDSDERDNAGTGGCNGGATPLPNHINLLVGRHVGPARWTWSAPVALASPKNARVIWPWVAAGASGSISVVWYQMDKMTDPDCDTYFGQTQNPNTRIMAAQIFNATSPARSMAVVDAAGRPIHQGGICDSGTTCVATGQDRRLGDFFTNAIDETGCVMISSGDTTVLDPVTGGARITSLPIFIQQNSGPSLTGRDCATGAVLGAAPTPSPTIAAGGGGNVLPKTSTPPSQAVLGLLAITAAAALAVAGRRRRRPAG